MRRAFVETLCELAAADDRIVLLTGDLGFLALEPFRDRYPQRFFNVGVAEQNMMGVATGLAEAGFRPYTYSIATFAAMRAFEFIRNGPVLHRLPVRIVGMGMGFDYGHSGATHYAVEDIAVMRSLPGLRVAIPCDSRHAAAILKDTANHAGPVYYSLSKNDALEVPGMGDDAAPLKSVRAGRDILILAMGSIVTAALAAAESLGQRGVDAAVAVVSGFNPDPDAAAARLLAGFSRAVTVEAQTLSGGLGAFTAGVIARHGLACKLTMLGVREPHDGRSGSQAERWRSYGIDADAIMAAIL